LKEIIVAFEETSQATVFRRILLWSLSKDVMVGGHILSGEDQDKDPPKRKVLVLINPFGGAGAAARNWETARALMEKAYIDLDVLFTERAQHAYDMCNKELKPEDYDSIVTVSGDGLIFEVVNGFLNRPDWNDFRQKVTIGCIPGGTGNGLVKSILSNSNENYGVLEAAFKIVKGHRKLIDVNELTGEYESKKIYSFLCVSWAIIGDIDINSEVIRCCGAARFTVWGVWRLMCMRRYRADFIYRGERIRNRLTQLELSDGPTIEH